MIGRFIPTLQAEFKYCLKVMDSNPTRSSSLKTVFPAILILACFAV